jgi:hypothetical protein
MTVSIKGILPHMRIRAELARCGMSKDNSATAIRREGDLDTARMGAPDIVPVKLS